MQHQTNRLRWAVLPVAWRVGGVVALCFAALSFLVFRSIPHAKATGLSRMIPGTISSSPASGPVGTTISVSGSGWEGSDGTPVSFGYIVNSSCSIVADSQNGSLSGGSFSGWFRWPSGTALYTYSICAMIGNTIALAGNFSVLSFSPPAVSISPSTLAPNAQATITATNYFPTGTPVHFLWMSGNTVVENLYSVASNTSGVAVLTFMVPKLSIANGSYTIDASADGSQPGTLFSSVNFTYTAPGVSPSPTPRPSPTTTPAVTPTTTKTPAATPTTRASATVTTASPTAGATPTVGNGQTPTTNGTNSGNNGNTNTGTSTSSSPDNFLLIAGMAVLSGALLAGVALLWLLSRRRKAAARAKVMPPRLPGSPGQAPLVNPYYPQSVPMYNGAMLPPLNNALPLNGSLPGNANPLSYPSYNPVPAPTMFAPRPGTMPAMLLTPAPVGAGAWEGNGNRVAPVAHPDTGAMPPPLPPPLPPLSQPPAWLSDPALDAMRRQAQSGLFVAPRTFKDERSK